MRRAYLVLGSMAAGMALVVGTGGAVWWWQASRPAAPAPARFDSAAVVTQVQGLAELVTVKYVIEKVVVLEDVKLWGENRILLVAHGVVKAGVDLRNLGADAVAVDGPRVRVRLPPATITDCYLDEEKTAVIEHTTGLLRRFDRGLEQAARREGLDAIRRAAGYSGILVEAEERARLQVVAFLQALGVAEIEVTR
ncbi:MAG: DUF4230 domain-containing protein [Verrucomicrobia bacterium]|nr:DUF4230 domain-containing protein [Verrucomicrobiota bacterium]